MKVNTAFKEKLTLVENCKEFLTLKFNSQPLDLQAEKLRLIEWLAGLNDELVSLKNAKSHDWWDEISAEEKSEIEEGIAQADRGELVPHEEVMKTGF